jgi:uncharacterized tellurite resistance protein B-like protein
MERAWRWLVRGGSLLGLVLLAIAGIAWVIDFFFYISSARTIAGFFFKTGVMVPACGSFVYVALKVRLILEKNAERQRELKKLAREEQRERERIAEARQKEIERRAEERQKEEAERQKEIERKEAEKLEKMFLQKEGNQFQTGREDRSTITPPPIPSVEKPSVFMQVPQKHTLEWVPSGQSITIHGYLVKDGLIYVSNGEPPFPEASAINTQLMIGRPVCSADRQLPYYPQYKDILLDQRATYLAWLAAGRMDVDPRSRELGYVFIFFYGLEHRLLYEGRNDPEVIHEIERLLLMYGDVGRSSSLSNYACQLLHFWGWNQGPDLYSKVWPWILRIKNSVLTDDMLAMILANLYQSGKPLEENLAYEILSRDGRCRASVVISRVNKEFQMLFKKRYLEKYPNGMSLKASKRNRKIMYTPASPTLVASGEGLSIPDVQGIPSQFNPAIAIWDSCIDDLSAYSRARAGSGDELTVKAIKALPDELRDLAGHPLAEQWGDLFKKYAFETRSALMPVSEIASFIGLPRRESYAIGQSRDIAQSIESFGFCVEPDARHTGFSYRGEERLGIFKPNEGQSLTPSSTFLAASVLLQLCILIAAADGNVQNEELVVIQEYLKENLQLVPEDRHRLNLLVRLLVKDTEMAERTATKIAKRLPADKRSLVGDVLVLVAAADNVITHDEMRALRRVFKMLSIPQDTLDATIRKIRPDHDEVQIQKGDVRQPGERIPEEARREEPAGFVLDEARIKAIHDETREVIGILALVMEEQEEEFSGGLSPATASSLVQASENAEESVAVAVEDKIEDTPDWMESLDEKFRVLMLRLITRTTWSRDEFNALAGEFCLMPLSVYDEIQQWSDESLGDFLLEGEDPIEVHTELIPEENRA